MLDYSPDTANFGRTAMKKILVVEDEELMRSILRRLLTEEGYDVYTADSAESALKIFGEHEISVVMTDIRMPGIDGLELLDCLKQISDETIVIIMTAYSSVDSAVAALRKGAYDYIAKPFVNEELLQCVRNAITQRDLFLENRALRRELNRGYASSEIIGRSAPMKSLLEVVEKVAAAEASVLISGESGTGKELIARAIHFNSHRSAKPFLAVNCGALPESLLESELFGHQKGSFTGAVADKRGLFRSAEGGTIFLDEIGEMAPQLQVKLLRAIQEREVTPVGASFPIKFDARIVAATNRILEEDVQSGRFREDLYYRLNVVEIPVPPLRERREDIPLLVRHFAHQTARRQNLPEKRIAGETLDLLKNYSWPGNVRELENTIERAFVLSDEEIGIDSLPPAISALAGSGGFVRDAAGPLSLEEVERNYILETLGAAGRDKVEAARRLGIDLSTLYRKLKRYGTI